MNIPSHLGIIMDGNRRWARKRRMLAFEGHRLGAEKVKEVIRWCTDRGIKHLTLYTFSTENWQRPKIEIDFLLKLIERLLRNNLKEFQKEEGRMRFLGDRAGLPAGLRKTIEWAEAETKDNQRINVNILLNYGGRAEIIRAVKNIVRIGIEADELTEDLIAEHLDTVGQPDPDLIIRTSGEQRLSNFLTWQSAYSELYFCQKHWPEFSERDLEGALAEYTLRQRRMGK